MVASTLRDDHNDRLITLIMIIKRAKKAVVDINLAQNES